MTNDERPSSARPGTDHRVTSWLFRQRKFLPLPFIALGLWTVVRNGHPLRAGGLPRTLLDLTGWLLVVGGEGLRIWGVGHIGRKSRSSDIHAARLVTGGPYRHTRNPLYLGGFLLTLGLSVLTGSWWVALGSLAYWMAVYNPLMNAEELFLRGRFGEAYAAYCRAVPRWWPRLRPWEHASSSRWQGAELSKEYQTLLAIVGTALLIHASLIGSEWLRLTRARHRARPAVSRSLAVQRSTEHTVLADASVGSFG